MKLSKIILSMVIGAGSTLFAQHPPDLMSSQEIDAKKNAEKYKREADSVSVRNKQLEKELIQAGKRLPQPLSPDAKYASGDLSCHLTLHGYYTKATQYWVEHWLPFNLKNLEITEKKVETIGHENIGDELMCFKLAIVAALRSEHLGQFVLWSVRKQGKIISEGKVDSLTSSSIQKNFQGDKRVRKPGENLFACGVFFVDEEGDPIEYDLLVRDFTPESAIADVQLYHELVGKSSGKDNILLECKAFALKLLGKKYERLDEEYYEDGVPYVSAKYFIDDANWPLSNSHGGVDLTKK